MRARARVSCIGRRILNHYATREVPLVYYIDDITGKEEADTSKLDRRWEKNSQSIQDSDMPMVFLKMEKTSDL